jgi:hypothetical protein
MRSRCWVFDRSSWKANSVSDEDDEDDEPAALMRELAKVRKEREEQRAKEVLWPCNS